MDKTQALIKKFTQTTEYAVPSMDMGMPPMYSNRGVPHVGEPKGQDTVPAWLTPGEAVIPKEGVDAAPELVSKLIDTGRAIQDGAKYANKGLKLPANKTNIEEEIRVLRSIHGSNTEGVIRGLMANLGMSEEQAIMAIRNKNDGGIVYANTGNFSILNPGSWFGGSRKFYDDFNNSDNWVTDDLLDSLKEVESGGQMYKTNKDGTIEYDDAGYPMLLTSPSNAQGAYQFLQPTAIDAGYGVDTFNIHNEAEQRKGARQYLEGIQRQHPDWSKEDVLMAYNYGPGNVEAMKEGLIPDNKVPQEALNYAGKVLGGIPESTASGPTAGELSMTYNDIPMPMKMKLEAPDKLRIEEDEGLTDRSDIMFPEGENYFTQQIKPSLDSAQQEYPLTSEILSYLGKKGKKMYDGLITAYKDAYEFKRLGRENIRSKIETVAGDVTIAALEAIVDDKDFTGPRDKLKQKIEELKKKKEKETLKQSQNEAAAKLLGKSDPEQTTFPYDDDSVNVASGEPNVIPENFEGELDNFGYPIIPPEVEAPETEIANNQAEEFVNEHAKYADRHGGSGPAGNITITDEQAKKAVDNAPEDWTDGVVNSFKNAFSSLFNGDELARMAIMYAGSRLFGYDHGDSFMWATEGYLNRIAGIEKANAAGLKDRQDKAVTTAMIDNFEKKSIDNWVKTNDRSLLIPKKEATDPIKIETVLGYGVDTRTNRKVEKVKLTDDSHAYVLNGIPRTYDWILDNLGPGIIDISAEDEHDQMKLATNYEQLIRGSLNNRNQRLNTDKIEFNGSIASIGDANVLGMEMANYALNKRQEYNLNINQKSKLNQAMQRAASEYMTAMDNYLRNGGVEPSFEGYANKQFIVLQTAGALGSVELKNVIPQNSIKLLNRFENMIDFDEKKDAKQNAKEMNSLISKYKKAWNTSKNRHSYGNKYKKSFIEDGWSPMTKWMYDVTTLDADGNPNPPDSALKVMFTQESINKFLASKPRDADLLDEIK